MIDPSPDRQSADIDAIVKAEAGDNWTLVMRARTMFVHARRLEDDRIAAEWAIIGIALADSPPAGVEGID